MTETNKETTEETQMPLKYTKCFTVGMTHQYISLCHTNYSLNVKKRKLNKYTSTHTYIKSRKKWRVFFKTGSKQAGMQAMSNAQSS